jgi:hypothetical protein
MASANWEIVNVVDAIHGVDFTSGLDMEGDFCYTAEITAGPSLFVLRNIATTAINVENVKIRALLRKQCDSIQPFLFVRMNGSSNAYVMKLDNNIALYKFDLSDLNGMLAVAPIDQGITAITTNVTYNVSLSAYSLLDGSTVYECEMYDNGWRSEIKTVVEPDIVSGSVGFGQLYRFTSVTQGCLRAFFDDIEISVPQTFI